MASNSQQNSNQNKNLKEAGAGGGVLSTVIIYLGSEIEYIDQSLLMLIAPSIAISITALWLVIKNKIDLFFNKKRQNNKLKILEIFIKQKLEKPDASQEYKLKLMAKLEEVELQLIDKKMK